MKHRTRQWVFFLPFVLLLFHSCENNDFASDEYENPDSYLILEARDYFEDYASMEMQDEPTGLHPGNIAPEWGKARVFIQPGTMAVNIPLITEATYEGSFYSETDTIFPEFRDTYFTAMLQKLIVVKDLETEIYSCYIATIIPSQEHATKNSAKIDKMFYGGDPASEFSGTVVYSTVTSNYTISVEKYTNGILNEQKSMFYACADLNADLNEMSQLMGSSRLKRNVRTMTKNGEYGGDGSYWLPEVVIKPTPTPTPTPPPSLPPPYVPPTNPGGTTPDPPYYPPGYTPPTPPPTTGGGGNGGSQQYPAPKISHNSQLSATEEALINKVLLLVYNKCKELGINISGITFKMGNCSVNAIKKEDGSIEICRKFLTNKYIENDRVSIIFHEIFHVKNDKSVIPIHRAIPQTKLVNVPSHIESYIKTNLIGGTSLDPQFLYDLNLTYENILPPQYYKNEIAAYEAEIEQNQNVSEAYRKEREYLLWRYRQELSLSEKYY